MNANLEKVKAIFLEAVEMHASEERNEYLRKACAGDDELQQHVEVLLEAHESGSLLDKGAIAIPPTIVEPIAEKPGSQIGPYKLLQQIGEGGMGVVYMAEQKEPVKRRVALKIIKPGMDTRQVIARFEAERQALAMMDHPNIAKVLDAGQTESGRPYFVMELVNGLAVTEYCDEQHLSPKERLELFVSICQAVQHAHQKGIIHRDLKPSNILVAMYDNKAVPKIIDFGVAKATSQTLTEKTMFTQLGQVVGTLEYMSPEQAQRNQLDIDTRSDIYSLGVVLYELLTGETPFDRARLQSAAFEEMLRIIREEEPSKPSTKVISSQSLPSIAANRRIEPAKLGNMIRGELDWIVLKAMEKDRGRRYETASKFAEDVQHYLNDEAVVACPPSSAYQFRKFVRRNKTIIGTTTVVAASLIAGIIGTSWQALRATQAERIARQLLEDEQHARVQAEQARAAERVQRKLAEQEALRANTVVRVFEDLFTKSNPDGYNGKPADYTVHQFLIDAGNSVPDRLREQPAVEAELRSLIGRALMAFALPYDAIRQLNAAHQLIAEVYNDEHPRYLESLLDKFDILPSAMVPESKARLARHALKLSESFPDHVNLRLRSYLAVLAVEPWQRRLKIAEEAIRFADAQNSLVNPHTAKILEIYAKAKMKEAGAINNDRESTKYLNTIKEAESTAFRAYEIRRDLFGDENPAIARSLNQIAAIKRTLGDTQGAEELLRKGLAIAKKYDNYYLPTTLLRNIRPLMNAEEFEELLKSTEHLSDGFAFRSERAISRLKKKDHASFRADCKYMLEHCKDSQVTLNVVFACILAPDSVEDWTPVVAMARQPHPLNTSFGLVGPALYRAGRISESIDALKQMEQYYAIHDQEFEDPINLYRYLNWLFLAMAHQKAGNLEEARSWLSQAERETPRIFNDKKSLWWGWPRIGLELVMEESQKLVKGSVSSNE